MKSDRNNQGSPNVSGHWRLPDEVKSGGATAVGRPVSEARSWFETPSHYVSIGYRGYELGPLVIAEDAEEARREGQALCARFGPKARVLSVKKVVVQ
jgi:hypothetical protein